MIIARDKLDEVLRCNITTVTFTKVDGTERTMKCTTKVDLIPSDKLPKNNTTSTAAALRVFDVEKNEWRSFRYDSVKSVTF